MIKGSQCLETDNRRDDTLEEFENQVFKFDRKNLVLKSEILRPSKEQKDEKELKNVTVKNNTLPNGYAINKSFVPTIDGTKDSDVFDVKKEQILEMNVNSDSDELESRDVEDFMSNVKEESIETESSSEDNGDSSTEGCRKSSISKESVVGGPSCNRSRKSERIKSRTNFCTKKYESQLTKKLTKILKKEQDSITREESTMLQSYPELVERAKKRLASRAIASNRLKEQEDSSELLNKKCIQLAMMIQKAKYLIVYTGAGISTSANIPDYRGPQGVWTLLQKGQSMSENSHKALSTADPTLTHMALKCLYDSNKVKHIVSQNCDGLHIRSGIPKTALSEVHGNMYIEVCSCCHREYVRLFDVTEHTKRYHHRTGRFCFHCKSPLKDTIVHFGERGVLRWPLNWEGAEYHADQADVILCLGSSLKVLRRYTFLWCMEKPPNKRPKLIIVNLQWTPKDQFAKLKINGKCDVVMEKVMEILNLQIPKYDRSSDPIFSICTFLHPKETHSKNSEDLTFPDGASFPEKKIDLNNYIRLEHGERVPPSPQREYVETEDSEETKNRTDEDLKCVRTTKKRGKGWFGNNWGFKPKKKR